MWVHRADPPLRGTPPGLELLRPLPRHQMGLWVQAPWLPLALLLMLVPGCLPLRCPSSVNGTVGGSLRVRCTYEEEDTEAYKYWCESSCVRRFDATVWTSATQREARSDRVTLRDEPANLSFTVTMEDLTEADAGTYYCGVTRSLWFDPEVRIVVSVSTALATAPPAASANPAPSLEPSEPTGQTFPDLHPSTDPGVTRSRSLLSSIHFRLLIFLKAPLLLCMMGAVLWVTWPRRGPVRGGQRRATTSSPV